jgi:hypothetical protein
MLRGRADQHQLVDARRSEDSDLLRDLATERVADDAGSLQAEMAHEGEDVASHVAYRVVVAGNAAVADVTIVRRD